MKIKQIIFLLLVLIVQQNLNAYNRYGLIGRKPKTTGIVNLSLGPSHCFSDMHGSAFETSFLDSHNFRVALGYKIPLKNNFAVSSTFQFGNYTGRDLNYSRDFFYISNIMGLTVRGEYGLNFRDPRLGKFNHGRYSYLNNEPNTLYTFLGAGILNANITDYLPKNAPKNIFRQNSFAFAVPFGIGYERKFGSKFTLGLELEWQYAFSDFLEGFKPPAPGSKNNDILGGIYLKFAYKLY